MAAAVSAPRTAWDSLIDVVTAYVNDPPVSGGDSVRAVILAAIERTRAALERPRPAPPPEAPIVLARLLAEYLGNVIATAPDKPAKVNRVATLPFAEWLIAHGVSRGGSAGTGAAPPEIDMEKLAAEVYEDANGQGWHSATPGEQAEYRTKIKAWVRGGAAQPPPSDDR